MDKFNRTVENIKEQDDLELFREIVSKQGKKLVLFGAGDCGHVVYGILHHVNIPVHCFCDNVLGGQVDGQTGLAIVKPEYLKDRSDELTILVCAVEEEVYSAICQQAVALGFDRAQIHIMREYYSRPSVSYLENNIQKYRNAYRLLEDEFSRKVFLARMKKVYLMGDISEVVSPYTEEYFDENVILTDEEVFIDCGGFDGDTAVKFIERCGGKY